MARTDEDYGYRSRSYDEAKKHRDARGGFDRFIKREFKVYKVKDGKNRIRIMHPTWDESDHYAFKIYVNYQIGPDKTAYLSLAKMGKGPDPLDEARRVALREDEEQVAKDLAPRERALMWIIDRDAEDEGPQLWPAPKSVDSDILDISIDEDNRSLQEIDHPTKGRDLTFYKTGQGLNTEYPAAKMRLKDPSPLHEDPKQRKEWVDFIKENPVPETLQFYDYAHIAKVFNGHSAKPAAVNDEADEPAPKPKAKAKPSDDAEDDEPAPKPKAKARPSVDIEDPPFEDDEPGVKAKPKSAKAKPEPEDEDDEESIRARLKERRRAKADDDDE